TYAIDKTNNNYNMYSWRQGLAESAANSISNNSTEVYLPRGPFDVSITMRDGEETAKKLARTWGLVSERDKIFTQSPDMGDLYVNLIRLCYLTPFLEKILPIALFLYKIVGRLGQAWVRRKIKSMKI
ncbi:hypothetical protein ACFL20_11850, partial [Spirochaetota bacterium]